MLPGTDGLEVCREIQREHPLPVLMLTARDDETDVIVGLEVGADDYMTKPFSPRELVARVRALLRRRTRERPIAPAPLELGDIRLDAAARTAERAGEPVHLTATEFDLARFLLAHPGVVYTREQLLHAVWGYANGAGPRTVDSHVQALRRKLGPSFVRTAHGVGYALGAAR
jgi:DNA-binding response OmpR family regulator